MKKFGFWIANLSTAGKAIIVGVPAIICGLLYWQWDFLFPKALKTVEVTTKATSLPPLAYDKNASAPLLPLPAFNEPADVQSPEMRGLPFGWNGFTGVNYLVGGSTTAKGSLAELLKLNIHLTVNNSCTEQLNQLYAFAQGLHDGEAQPTKGVHFICLMGDGVPNYLTGLNNRITKDFGAEYCAKVVTFAGASFGEDKWMVKARYQKDARGSLTCTVIRDGDWNICMIKSQLMGWNVNHNLGTYDRNKVNFIAAPNDDYIEATKMYVSGQKVTLKIVENGKYTGKDTTIACNGVSTWFPADAQAVQNRGGLVTIASTKDYGAQMATAIIMIGKWADANRPLVEAFVEGIGRAGEQIKAHDEALRFGTQVNELVFADKEKSAEDWYNGYKSYNITDEDGNEVNVGGSRVFSLADAAAYTGVSGGTDKYKTIYTTFGNICKEAYPEVLTDVFPYEQSVDWSYLKAAYGKAKKENTAGSVSKMDLASAQKGAVIGDAAFAIEFNTGSAEISPASYAELDKILGSLTAANNSIVEIAGHTDNTGDATKNITLSEQRATAVKMYLQKKNTDLQISSKGLGQTTPVHPTADQNSKAERDQNRRVEIKLFRPKE